jgi:hypothetical protein
MGVPDLCARWRAINALQVAVGTVVVVALELHRTCPVNYSGAAVVVSRSWRVPETALPGAPDMSGGTPDSPVRQTRGAFGCPFALLLNPILGLFIG